MFGFISTQWINLIQGYDTDYIIPTYKVLSILSRTIPCNNPIEAGHHTNDDILHAVENSIAHTATSIRKTNNIIENIIILCQCQTQLFDGELIDIGA